MSPHRVVWVIDWPILLLIWPVYVYRALLRLCWWCFVVPFRLLRWVFGGRR